MTVTLDEMLARLPADERARVEERGRELVAEVMRRRSDGSDAGGRG
jgi:hypothetical protein